MNDPKWLSDDEQRSWRALLWGTARFAERMTTGLASTGLTLDDYEVLVELSEAPDRRLRMSDLAEFRVCSRSRLTHHIGRLETRGFVERMTCNQDRRGTWAQITDAGFAILESAAPHHVNLVRESLLDLMSEEEFAVVGEVFERVLIKLHPSDIDRLPH